MLPDTEVRLKRNARIVYKAAAAGLKPDPRLKISEWAEQYRIVPDMGAVPGPWRNDVAPELVEIMDAMSPGDPTEHGVVSKCSQSGGSAVAENMLGFIMHKAPGPAMYIQTTVAAAKDWKAEKLDPTIAATPVLNPAAGGAVTPQRSRSGDGSVGNRLRFKGGFLLFAGANSAASLRQHSIRYMVRDDRAGWTNNADNEGDPRVLSDQRIKTYRVFGLAKVLDISSPLDEGDSFDQDIEKSDKRRYYMACLGCGSITDFVWEDVKKNETPPYRCHFLCPACGRSHFDADKKEMKRPARGACWIVTAPDADGVVPPKTIAPNDIDKWRNRQTGRLIKGWYITGEINTFDTWDLIAQAEADAGDDPVKVKPFENTTLGRKHKITGTGPAWEHLSARRDAEFERGVVPAGAFYITLAADVKGDGIHWERLGWGPNKENWLIDYGFEAGETDVPFEGAWPKLDAVVERGSRYGHGRMRDDLIGVDSGYNVDAVYLWVKRRHNALAVKGIDGWSKPAIFRAENTEVKKYGFSAGKAKRYGLKVWLIGTWGIKGALMVYLARMAKEGQALAPTGLCHFPGNVEEEYFRHLVSETVEADQKDDNKRIWVRRGPNHWLDCRVYNYALTHYAGLWNWDEKRWALAAIRLDEMTKAITPDLFEPDVTSMSAPPPIVPQVTAEGVAIAVAQAAKAKPPARKLSDLNA